MEIKKAKILVTGGAGFIGSHLVDSLLLEGNQVTVLDNFTSGKIENLIHHRDNKKLTIIEGDVRNKSLVFEITENVDIVYHLAVQCLRVSIKNPESNHEVNATGALNICMACLENKVNRLVYVSSSEVYGTALKTPMSEMLPLSPMTVYGASKAVGELYALAYNKTYGLNSIVIRPFNTYGPRSHFEGAYGEVIPKFVLRLLNDLPPVIFGNGHQTRDFTYVTDIVKGIIMASASDKIIGNTVNIARGQEISVNELVTIISEKLGRKNIKSIYEKNRPGDVMRHCADITKAREMFGYNPTTDIENGIEEYLKWFISQGYNYKELLKDDVIFNWQ